MRYVGTSGKPGWYWTPWTYRFDHGGWVFFDWRKPRETLRWFWRFWRGAPGCDRYNPSQERYGAIRYAAYAAHDGIARVRRQTAKDYWLWRLGSGKLRSAIRTVPELLTLALIESRVFADRMRRGRFWGHG
jgi:hypothetical protein